MFAIPDEALDSLKAMSNDLNANYKIASDDYLGILVYTSKGEMLIDPEKQFFSASGAITPSTAQVVQKYLVDNQGFVNLPMIGRTAVEGFTLPQADSLLGIKYGKFYDSSFVITSCENRRVSVLGAFGNKVLPLVNENTNLIEVLAMAGTPTDFKAQKIRLIRGDLKNPEVQVIDLSTIQGMQKANLKIHNHDIIYVEPRRKVFIETLQDFTPVFSIATTIFTLLILLNNPSK